MTSRTVSAVFQPEKPVLSEPSKPLDSETGATSTEPAAPVKKPRVKQPKKASGNGTKRGPSRPYKKLQTDILKSRIQKLTTRIDKARNQLKDSETFLAKYMKEEEFRGDDKTTPAESAEAE